MEKQIYLVIEIGTGIIHRAFESKSEALKFIEILKIETDMDCYELHSVEFQIQSNL